MQNQSEISDKDIRKNGLVFMMIDDLLRNRKFLKGRAAVVNTAATRDPNGLHWLAMKRFEGRTVEGGSAPRTYVFDPLGPKNNTRPHDDIMGQQLERLGEARWFPYATQSKRTHHCGWFSIAVAKILDSFDTIDEAEEEIMEHFVRAEPEGQSESRGAKQNVSFLIKVAGYVPSPPGSDDER